MTKVRSILVDEIGYLAIQKEFRYRHNIDWNESIKKLTIYSFRDTCDKSDMKNVASFMYNISIDEMKEIIQRANGKFVDSYIIYDSKEN